MTANWNTSVWAQQRNILTLSAFGAGATHARITITGYPALTALYIIPASGVLQVDMSDVVRMYQSGTFTVTEMAGSAAGSSITRTWSRAGLISPLSVIIPETDLTTEGAIISPPSEMLYSGLEDIMCEAYYENSASWEDWSLTGSAVFVANTQGRQIQAIGDFIMTNGAVSKACRVHRSCLPTCLVEWVSFTGRTRRHVFEAVKQTIEAKDAVQIETISNEYDERKGRRDGFTLRLDGLNRYDFWYYADIITSSKVEVSFDGSIYTPVQVTTKSVEIPTSDEGELNTLEIQVNYKQYDTL